jgi:Arc/MetJ-type ribon-helix-helix transcriptional regulator
MTSSDNIYKNSGNKDCMANTLISIRMSEELLKDINELTKSQGYSNIQEFLRAAAREKIQKEKISNATIALENLYGSAKNRKIHLASKKELDVLARRLHK